jgi:hypothetical protein
LATAVSRSDLRYVSRFPSAIEFAEASYGNVRGLRTLEKRDYAGAYYEQQGYRAFYYHPRYSILLRDPNVFLIARPGSHRVMVLFHGTEWGDNWFDVVQDLRMRTSRAEVNEGSLYIPTGHLKKFRGGSDDE